MQMRKVGVGWMLACSVWWCQATAQTVISVSFGPPPLPVYEQPPVPGDGYIWTPGYWRWDPNEGAYFWAPGVWMLAPFVGGLWTPGYWFYSGSDYRWRPGYWAREVGFYGGIRYGHGYDGRGYDGGRWHGSTFSYNRAVTRVDDRVVHHVYDARPPRFVSPGGPSFADGHLGPSRPVDDRRARPAPQPWLGASPASPDRPWPVQRGDRHHHAPTESAEAPTSLRQPGDAAAFQAPRPHPQVNRAWQPPAPEARHPGFGAQSMGRGPDAQRSEAPAGLRMEGAPGSGGRREGGGTPDRRP